MDTIPAGWQGFLDPGERIVWQGRPGTGLDFSRETLLQAAFGLPLLVFGLIWFAMTRDAAADGWLGRLFPLIGLGMIAAGIWQTVGSFAWDAWLRRHMWYTLTDRRAFIATDTLGRRNLKSWPIDVETLLDYDGSLPGTIWFAEEFRAGPGPGRRQVGFRLLPDARQVHELMRQVQRRQA